MGYAKKALQGSLGEEAMTFSERREMPDFELMKCLVCKTEWNRWDEKISDTTAVEYQNECPKCGNPGYSLAVPIRKGE